MAALLCVVALCVCSCRTVKRSEAWTTVTSMQTPRRGDPRHSENFAREMHAQLIAKGVESKLVRIRYTTNRNGQEQTRIHEAVVYRNETTPDYPWWFMDNMRTTPEWLPNGTLADQVRFATRLSAFEIIGEDGSVVDTGGVMTAAGGGSRPASTQMPRVAASAPAEPLPVSAVPAVPQAQPQPQPQPPAVTRPAPPAVAERTREVDWNERFRRAHGTPYDSRSATDRKKMAALKKEKLSKRPTDIRKRNAVIVPQTGGAPAQNIRVDEMLPVFVPVESPELWAVSLGLDPRAIKAGAREVTAPRAHAAASKSSFLPVAEYSASAQPGVRFANFRGFIRARREESFDLEHVVTVRMVWNAGVVTVDAPGLDPSRLELSVKGKTAGRSHVGGGWRVSKFRMHLPVRVA